MRSLPRALALGVLVLSFPHSDRVRAQSAGLVAAYGFEEATGLQVTDAAANGHTGTIAGATRTTAGRYGRAIQFDGVDDWITIADAPGLDLTTGMTLEAWVYPTAQSGWRTAVLKESAGGLAYALYPHANAPRPSTYINTGGIDVEAFGAGALPLNAWTFLAATYDGATLRTYVNGTLAGSLTHSGSIIVTAGPLRIGGNAVWGEYFTGRIDEVRVYNRPLSQTELQQDMNRPVVGTDTTPPAVTSVLPPDGAANVSPATDVSAVFSEDLNAATVTAATFILRDQAGASIPASVSYTAATRQARLQPASSLAPASTYTARLIGGAAGVKDLSGNSLPADVVWTFTTGADSGAPIVVSRSPAAGAINVATSVDVTATFSEAMQADSISFALRTTAGASVPATVSYDAASLTATLRPAALLAPSTSYTATVAQASDAAGNPLAGPVSWSFTTGVAAFQESIVFSGLTEPTVVEFASDGRVFVAEKSGLIKIFDSLTDSTPVTFADLRTKVHNFWDRGLLGMALHPNFPTVPYVYVLYTHDAAIGATAPRWGSAGATSDPCPNPPGATADGCVVSGRLSRLEASGNVMVGAEQVLVEDWAQQFPSHSVGSLAFGPDGALYASAGDGANFNVVDYGQDGDPPNPFGDPPVPVGGTQTPPTAEGGALRSQDLRTSGDPVALNGAVVRIDPATGLGLPDNPLAGHADANARRIVAHGFRNPFRLAVRPGTEELYVADVGWNDWEEIDRIADASDSTAENFGWPCYEGANRQGGYDAANLNICENLYAQAGAVTNPYYAYAHASQVVPGESCAAGSSSISGLAFYSGGSYPASYNGALFFSDYSRNCIWVMFAGADGRPNPANRATFRAGAAGPVELKIGPGGDLFYVDFGGTIRRIRHFDGNRPPVARATAVPSSGAPPLTVTFNGSTSSDSDAGDSLTYAWDLDGDGFFDDGAAVTASFTYTAAGVYTARLRVTDSQGLSDVGSVVVSANSTPPAATIQTPVSSLTWRVGDVIGFSGMATDAEDGPLPSSALSWSLILQHCSTAGNCHSHPLQTFAGVAQGSFSAPDHEYPSYLELTLTATDSTGLIDSETVRLDPQTVALSFESSPSGMRVAVGSSAGVTTFTKTVIVGSVNSISAESPQSLSGIAYEFVSWSDGGAQTHAITAPSAPATYRATYSVVPSIAIGDATATEADGPGPVLSFPVTLSGPTTQTVTVSYSTAAGTATSGSDYSDASGTLTFPPGTTSQSIPVAIAGDMLDEATETFTVMLANPVHAALADASAVGTIVDNDPAPSLSVDDVQVTEGNSGTTVAAFTVRLSAASGIPVAATFATANGTATAGVDYAARTGTLTLPAGATSATVDITVQGDFAFEPDETFLLTLTAPTNATLFDAQGVALIRNDDTQIAAGLMAAYGFEEASGSQALDVSGRGHPGTISGATRTTSGRFGRALSFDGINDWVTVADAADLDLTTGMTLEAWVNPTALSGWRTAILKEAPGGLAYALYPHNNAPRPAVTINLGGSDVEALGTSQLPLNAWTHLAATYDGATLRLYVNGVVAGTRAIAGSLRTTASPLRIGGNSVWGEWFRGRVDEVRIYNRPLSQAEIQQDMQTAVGGGS